MRHWNQNWAFFKSGCTEGLLKPEGIYCPRNEWGGMKQIYKMKTKIVNNKGRIRLEGNGTRGKNDFQEDGLIEAIFFGGGWSERTESQKESG